MAPVSKSAAVTSTTSKPKSDKNKPKKDNKPVNEIEEIFKAAKKRKASSSSDLPENNKAKKKPTGKNVKMGEVKEKPRKKMEKEVDSMKKRRKTNDGLTIYSAEELGIGNPDAGETNLCPFDCDCCF